MLRELSPTRQPPGDPPRVWFASPRCDLIIWLRDEASPMGFQFCYGKPDSEHALTWFEGLGFSHMRVDAGGSPFGKGTPLLVANGTLDADRILESFRAESRLVPAPWVELICRKLEELKAV